MEVMLVQFVACHDISVRSEKTFRMRGAFLKRDSPPDKTIVFSLLKVCPALRSREARRLKENQIAMRAAYLEKQVKFIVVLYLFVLEIICYCCRFLCANMMS